MCCAKGKEGVKQRGAINYFWQEKHKYTQANNLQAILVSTSLNKACCEPSLATLTVVSRDHPHMIIEH